MHDKPMAESDGEFLAEPRPAITSDGEHWPCPKCDVAGRVTYEDWDSSDGGYSDVKYHCEACGKTWWVEGADA